MKKNDDGVAPSILKNSPQDNFIVRDRRGGNKYIIDNSVYDMALSCEALAMYNGLCRYSHKDTERPYFSMRKFMSHHKVGKAKATAARAELIEKKLVRVPKERHESGAWFFELLQPPAATVAAPPAATVAAPPAAEAAAKQYNINKADSNNNMAVKPASLYTRVVDLISKAHHELTGEVLVFASHGKAYGQAVKQIIEMAGPGSEDEVFERVRAKVKKFYKLAKAEIGQHKRFYSLQGITPLSIRVHWNKLVEIKSGTASAEAPKMPPFAELSINEANQIFVDWRPHFTENQLREYLPGEIWKEWQHEKNGFAGALLEIVMAYKKNYRGSK